MKTGVKLLELSPWKVLYVTGRVDAFNGHQLLKSFHDLKDNGHHQIAVDLSSAEFLSLAMLNYLASLTRELRLLGGELVLVSPSHNVRKQIDIFLGVKSFKIFQSYDELKTGVFFQPRSEFYADTLFIE